MNRFAFPIVLVLAACGANAPVAEAPASPTTTAAAAPPPVAESEPKAAPPEEPPPAPAPPPADPEPEKCDAGWVCLKVSLDSRKVEKRETKLLGDPKIETTWSKNSDGRPATFDAFSKGAVEVTLRRKPANKNEVVLKPPKGGEIVVDRRDGTVDDFTHIGVIAAEKDGAFLLDIKYSR
ncbi:MAG: hypothetical protein KF819_02855 [Labilithrix sp.]|nr:hypothetical protein [Labilithrix sp.]